MEELEKIVKKVKVSVAHQHVFSLKNHLLHPITGTFTYITST